MGSATIAPWLSPWPAAEPYGQQKLKALEYYRALAQGRARQRTRLTIYAYGQNDNTLRLGGWNATRPLAGYPLEQFPLDPLASAPQSDLARFKGKHVSVDWSLPTESPAAHHAHSVMSMWMIATAVLVVLVVLLRAMEKCFDVSLLKLRRQSHEWSPPNVRATRRRGINDGTVVAPAREDAELHSAHHKNVMRADLPPPYSECTWPGPATASLHKPNWCYTELPPEYNSHFGGLINNEAPSIILVKHYARAPLITRRDVIGPQTGAPNNEATTTGYNVANTNNEVDNETGNLESNKSTTNASATENENDLTMTKEIKGNAVEFKNKCETKVDIEEDENSCKNEVMLV